MKATIPLLGAALLFGLAACGQTTGERTLGGGAASANNAQADDIVDVIQHTPQFSTLAQAITKAELVEPLADAGPYTVFAPTNDAFNALPQSARDKLLQQADTAQLEDLLRHHIILGEAHEADDIPEQMTSMEGDPITVSLSQGGPVLSPSGNGPQATVTGDIQAGNGIIHSIDAVLIPQQVAQALQIDLQQLAQQQQVQHLEQQLRQAEQALQQNNTQQAQQALNQVQQTLEQRELQAQGQQQQMLDQIEQQLQQTEQALQQNDTQQAQQALSQASQTVQQMASQQGQGHHRPADEEAEVTAAGQTGEAGAAGQGTVDTEQLIGTTALTPEGEDLGEIGDLVVSEEGEIEAAVIDVGGFLGIGGRQVAVDWSKVRMSPDGEQVVVNMTREELETAPEYEAPERLDEVAQ